MPVLEEWMGDGDVGTQKSNDEINRLSFSTLAYVSECARVSPSTLTSRQGAGRGTSRRGERIEGERG